MAEEKEPLTQEAEPTTPEAEATTLEAEPTVDTEQTARAETPEAPQEPSKADTAQEENYKDQLMRLRADFDNYKKRTSREKADIAAYTTEGLFKKLLPVVDNLERAQAAAESDEDSQVAEGVRMVFDELMGVLKDEGLEEIEAEGQPFDPNFHHGVAVANDPESDDQVVLNVFQKGYTYKDRVVRAAMVQINQK